MESLKKEFLTNLIAINDLAELIADNPAPDAHILLQLKQKTALLHENTVVLHYASNNVEEKSTPAAVKDTITEEPIALVNPNEEEETPLTLFAEEIIPAQEINAPIAEQTLQVETAMPVSIAEEKVSQPKEEIPAAVAVKKFKELNQFLAINDRIQIQQYLFNGDAETFQNFIKMIDSSDSSQKAIGIINGFKNQYGWDNESDAFVNLISIIEQKFRS